MKKFFTSLVFVFVFAGYGLYRSFGDSAGTVYVNPAATEPTVLPTPVAPNVSAPPVVVAPTPTQQPVAIPTPTITPKPVATPTATPIPKPQGQYIDGSYTGSVDDAYYGNVQVQVTVTGGKMTDVAFLQYPSDRSTSRYINSRAMPILKSEAIQSQSAQVNTVSGATDTSGAFRQSLADALSQAKS